jgi:transposase-like protein
MTTASLIARAHEGTVPDDDPAARPAGRHFSASYKLAILNEYEQTTDARAKGALLRREGLYSSHIVEWRRARDVGALRAPRSSGDPSAPPRAGRSSTSDAAMSASKTSSKSTSRF